MGVEGLKEREGGHTAAVRVQSEGLSVQGNGVFVSETYLGKGGSFWYEFPSLNPLLHYSGCASENQNYFYFGC